MRCTALADRVGRVPQKSGQPSKSTGIEIAEKFRAWNDRCDEKLIPRPRAGHIKQVAFGVVDLLDIGIVGNGLDALLQRQDLRVAGHHGHGPKLQPFGEMHGADRDAAGSHFDVFGQFHCRGTGRLDRRAGAFQLLVRADEHADFFRPAPFLQTVRNPRSDRNLFLQTVFRSLPEA
jgi:hypothetical protein